MGNGWIKLHRKLLDSVVFQNDKALKIWIWCLLRANHKSAQVLIGRTVINLNRGQFIMGSNKESKALKIAKTTFWRWLEFFESEQMLELKKTTKYTVVTIPNWDSYQETELKWDSSGTQLGTNKNEKNVNKDTFLPEKQDIEEVDENAKPKSVPKAEQPRVTDVMAIWNAYPNWKATGQKVSPRNPSVKEQLLPKAVQSADLTASILRKRSKYSLEEFEKAIKAYATEVANRAKDDSFYLHRWSLYEFLTYKDVFQRYVTR